MVSVLSRGLSIVLIIYSLVICIGCASSSPARFYQLSSVNSESAAARDTSRQQSIIVAVGPLRIPDYLNRPQIVTRSGSNEIRLAEFDRWAGSLDHDIVRVLVEDISTFLPAESFFVTPWVSTVQAQPSSWYRIDVNIIRFEGTRGKSVQLKAQWAIYDKEKGLLLRRESTMSEEVYGATYEAYVSALSKTLFSLSRDISGAILSL